MVAEAKNINGYRDGWRLNLWAALKPDEMEAVLCSRIFKQVIVDGTTKLMGNESFQTYQISCTFPLDCFLLTIESCCWVLRTVGGYTLQLLPVAQLKCFTFR